MSGKYALIIANTEYSDHRLAKLTAPGKDAEELARVLISPEIAEFDHVETLINKDVFSTKLAIEDFFETKKPDDLLVLYFSGHGVRDEYGTLHLAVNNTDRDRLRSTAIKSDFIREAMDHSRSKRQVLILDCCNSGAFAHGTKAEIGGSVGTAFAFEGTGYGRVVLTASDSTQFAWEGDRIIGETSNSLFTHFLVKGLEGEADRDSDGRITVDELYDYAYDQIVNITPKQTPGKWSYKQQGEIVLRQNIRIEDTRPVPLPNDLLEAISSSLPYIREGAVHQLDALSSSKNRGLANSAQLALEQIAKQDDSRRVSTLATNILERIQPTISKPEVETTSGQGDTQTNATQLRPMQENVLPKPGIANQDSHQPRKQTRSLLRIPKFFNKTFFVIASFVLLLSIAVITVWATFFKPYTLPDSLSTILPANTTQVQEIARRNIPYFPNILSISLSPDKTILASVLDDKTIRLWDINNGKMLDTLVSTTTSNSVVFSPNGELLASTSPENTIRLWRVSDGVPIRTLKGHKSDVWNAAFSPDGKTLASASSDNTVRLWQVNNGNLINTLDRHTGGVWSVAFSPDGKTLASGSYDKTIRLWRVSDGKLMQTLEGHSASVSFVAFSPNGEILASASDDKTIRLWRISDGELLAKLQGHTSSITSLAFSPDGETLASSSADNTIRLWRVSNGAFLGSLNGHKDKIWSVIFSNDGSFLVSGGKDGIIRIWGIKP